MLRMAGLKMDDIDLFEVNEAFAPIPLAWAKELKADRSKLNVNGGALTWTPRETRMPPQRHGNP